MLILSAMPALAQSQPPAPKGWEVIEGGGEVAQEPGEEGEGEEVIEEEPPLEDEFIEEEPPVEEVIEEEPPLEDEFTEGEEIGGEELGGEIVPEEFPEEDYQPEGEEDLGEELGDEGGEPVDLDTLPGQVDNNPLNDLGGSLDGLIQREINGDAWNAMLGDLPCLETSQECISRLQQMAIGNHRSLRAIQQRIDLAEERIAEARANNQRSVTLGSFTPLIENLVQLDTETEQVLQPNLLTGRQEIVTERRQVGFFQKLGQMIANPLNGINTILSFIGVPLFNGTFRIGDAAQERSIAISDLQIKVAQIEAEKQKIEDTIAEQVVLQVLQFDVYRRDFQIAQEIGQRQVLQHQLFAIDYRFGNYDTQQYLQSQSQIDQQKAQAYRAWAQLRAQLARLKLLILGTET